MSFVTIDHPESIRSPLNVLLRAFADAPSIIVPERRQELRTIVAQHNIRITLNADRHTFLFCVDPTSAGEARRIWVGLAVIERLWAYAYAFLSIHDVQCRVGHGTLISPQNTPSLAPAFALLNLAYGAEQRRERMNWSADLPHPGLAGQNQQVKLTNHFFLSICGFMLAHEVGHVVRQHPPADVVPPNQAIREEYEADQWACEFILGHPGEKRVDPINYAARANGIATGIALLATVELGVTQGTNRTHPNIPERLLTFFDHYLPEVFDENRTISFNDYPAHFVGCVLYAFMLARNIPYPYHQYYPTTPDLLRALIPLF